MLEGYCDFTGNRGRRRERIRPDDVGWPGLAAPTGGFQPDSSALSLVSSPCHWFQSVVIDSIALSLRSTGTGAAMEIWRMSDDGIQRTVLEVGPARSLVHRGGPERPAKPPYRTTHRTGLADPGLRLHMSISAPPFRLPKPGGART